MVFISDDKILSDKELYPLVKKMFSDSDFSLPGGESITNCQNRSVAAFKKILKKYTGQKIVIGTQRTKKSYSRYFNM